MYRPDTRCRGERANGLLSEIKIESGKLRSSLLLYSKLMRNGSNCRLLINMSIKVGAQYRESEMPEVRITQPQEAARKGCGGEG